MSVGDPREAFIKRYEADNYRHPTMVNHRGTVVAFSMGDDRRIYYTVLDLDNDNKGPLDVDHWLDSPRELPFPREVVEVGYGVVDPVTLPPMLLPSPGNPVEVARPEDVLPSELDAFWSSTGRLTADVPFQVLSDDQFIYVFRQAVGRDDGKHPVFVRDANNEEILDDNEQKVPLVDRTLLVDRYILSGTTLTLRREVRFRRSRSRTRPQSSKDSLGAKDMNGEKFVEPTQELSIVGNLVAGRFAIVRLPTAVAGVERWQVFAVSGRTEDDNTVDPSRPTKIVDSYNIERTSDGLFNPQGTQLYTSPEPEYRDAVLEREPGLCPFTNRPLVPLVSSSGYAEYALALDSASFLTVGASSSLSVGSNWALEMWIKVDTLTGESTLIARENLKEGVLSLLGNGTLKYRESQSGAQELVSTAPVPTGVWTHLAIVRSGSSAQLFLNGDTAGDSSLFNDGALANSGISIGAGLLGTLEEVRLWNYSRDLRSLIERRSNRLVGNEPGLVAYWRLDEGGGSIARDQSNYENDATLVHDDNVDADTLWVRSDAPIGDNPGVRRSSFFLSGREVVYGISATVYQESELGQTNASAPVKPLKQNTRVMLALVTTEEEAEDTTDPVVCIVDMGVGRDGRLAQTRDAMDLQPLEATFLDDLIGQLEQQQAELETLAAGIDVSEKAGTQSIEDAADDPVERLRRFEYNAVVLISYANDLEEQIPVRRQNRVDAREALISERDAKETEKAAKETEKAAKETEKLTKEGNLATAQTQLEEAQAAVDAASEEDENYSELVQARDDAQASVDGINTEISTLDGEISTLDEVISTLDGEITGLNGQVAEADEGLVTFDTNADKLKNDKPAIIDSIESDRNALDAVGDARPLKLVDIAPDGLTVTGGRLDYARTASAPFLFTSSEGEVSLYYQGVPEDGATMGQFYAAYYDTNTSRVSVDVPLNPPEGALYVPATPVLQLYSRSTEPEREGATITVADGSDADHCMITISWSDQNSGLQVTETWNEVPRAASTAADVVNGAGDRPVYLGTLKEKAWGTVEKLVLNDKLRRALSKGDVISLGGTRFTVDADVSRKTNEVSVATHELAEAIAVGTTLTLLPYDYTSKFTRTGGNYFGNGSTLFRAAPNYGQGLVQNAELTASSSERSSQWVARSPGRTYRFDGKQNFLAPASGQSINTWGTQGDLSIEAWAQVDRMAPHAEAALVWHTDSNNDDVQNYGLWIEADAEYNDVIAFRKYIVKLWGIWFAWLKIPVWTQELDPESPGFYVLAQAGTRRVRSKEVLLFDRWNHFSMTYNHSCGMELKEGAWLDAGTSSDLAITEDLTIEVFFRFDGYSNDSNICGLISRGTMGGPTEEGVPYSLSIEDGKLVFRFETKYGGKVAYSGSIGGLSEGSFYRVAAVRRYIRETKNVKKTQSVSYVDEDGDTQEENIEFEVPELDEYTRINLYVAKNGKRNPTDIGGGKYYGPEVASNRARTAIGRGAKTNGEYAAFHGAMAEVRLWNKALTEEEIFTELTATDGLVSWWQFEDNRGRYVTDAVGESNATVYPGPDDDGVGTEEGAKTYQWVPSPDPKGPRITIYRNGAPLKVTDHDPIEAGEDQFTLGGRQDKDNWYFSGLLEEVRVWRQVRTQEQIQDNMFTRLRGETRFLIAYYPFDKEYEDVDGLKWVRDHSYKNNKLALPDGAASNPTSVLSTAPVSFDTAQVRSALAQIPTDFHDVIGGRPGVAEYGDLQQDAEFNTIGVLKRCYTFVQDGSWAVVTGYKVGDLKAEWIGQVQFNPQIMGYIEGAPPIPSENLTIGPVKPTDSYAGRTKVEFLQSDKVTYTLSSGSTTGYDTSFEGKASIGFGGDIELVTAPLGIGTSTKLVEHKSAALSLSGKINAGASWDQSQTSSSSIQVDRNTSLELAGSWEDPTALLNEVLGPRWIPSNVGMALVQSETADVFALRLEHNGALVSYEFRPNPDIPPDWNLLHFPINPRYTKQGTLDGTVGYNTFGKVLDPDYPTASGYGEYSYFKPREAYALKRRIERGQQFMKAYYEDFDPTPQVDLVGLTSDGLGVLAGSLTSLGSDGNAVYDKVTKATDSTAQKNRVAEDFSRRSLVNTYVWTSDGGFFSESTSVTSVFQETVGGNYSFSGEIGVGAGFKFSAGASFSFEFNASLGGNLSYTRSKSEESEKSFSVDVTVETEGDLQKYIGLDGQYDPITNEPLTVAGKVDAYRFMTFFLEASSENYEDFFGKVIDPIWFEQSTAANAIALRQAQSSDTKPPCWRIFHRVTFVSRLLPEFGEEASPEDQQAQTEKALKDLDINSNYELVQRLDPFVRNATTDYSKFVDAVHSALRTYMPELWPHRDNIVEYLSLYYGLEQDIDWNPDDAQPGDATPPSGATTLHELAEDSGATHIFPFSDEARHHDIVGAATIRTRGGTKIGKHESYKALVGMADFTLSEATGNIPVTSSWGRSGDRTLEIVLRVSANRDGVLIQYDNRVGSNQRFFERLVISAGEGEGEERMLQFQVGDAEEAVPLPGLTLNNVRDKLLYMAISYNSQDGSYTVSWMLEGEGTASSIQLEGNPGSIAGGALFLGGPPPQSEGEQAPATGFELYHLAIYPRSLTSHQVQERTDLLALAGTDEG